MSVCCYGQNLYKYQIHIDAICRDLRGRVVDRGVGPTRIRDGLKYIYRIIVHTSRRGLSLQLGRHGENK